MKKIKRFFKKIAYCLYRITVYYLPSSELSRFSNFLRVVFAKMILKKCGRHVTIDRHAHFGIDITIGDYSSIGQDCWVMNHCDIGNNVMMGPECRIYTHNHMHSRTDLPMIRQGFMPPKNVKISDDVWIGARVIILPGVIIGEGSIIAAGAVVSKDVPSYTVVGGVPAKVLKKRPKNSIDNRFEEMKNE